jgi:hypothetical protein
MIDERAFTPMFLEACSDLELVALQYELRRFPEDRPYLTQVLDELGRRPQAAESTNGEGES